MRERQRLRFLAHDALIDQMKFRVGALALDRAGIENLVAGLEERDIGADSVDDAGGVVAENLGFTFRRRGTLAHLVIDRVG